MGLFSKKPSAQDINEAKEFIARFKGDIDKVVNKFANSDCQEPVEKTMLMTCAYICSGTLSKKAQACIAGAIVEAYTKSEIKGSVESEIGFVSIFLEKISNTFQNALKRGINPLYEIFETYYKGQYLSHQIFTENPFFAIEAKRTINNIIEKMGVTSLYQYKFTATELIFPKPQVFVNEMKAPQQVLTKNDGTPEYFYQVAVIDIDHSTYWVLKSVEKGDCVYLKIMQRMGGETKIEFINGDELHRVYEAYHDLLTVFSEYKCPLY